MNSSYFLHVGITLNVRDTRLFRIGCVSLFFTKLEEGTIFTISDTTGKRYDPNDVVFFRNARQAASYVLWGAELIDVFPTSDKIFVFVFSREDHNKYREKWNNHEN